jgi:hypothetical protein
MARTVRTWGPIYDDHVCSRGGCGIWEVQLNSKAYCDGTYAWGSRSRYGYAGWATKNGTKSAGYSIRTDRLGFSGDPSRRDLYATHDATVSAFARGFPMQWSRYVHRHYPGSCGRPWVVVG